MSEISQHPLEGKLTQEQFDYVMTHSGAEVSAAMHEWELQAGLRVRDELNPERLHEVEQVAPKFSFINFFS